MSSPESEAQPVKPQLGLFDAVCIIIGIVIGSSIFTTPPTIFQNVAGPWAGLGVWLVCGLLSLVGALCYAELATTYPRSGGDYVYLTRAFGRPVGFLFGWAQMAVILSGSTGAMAFIFGEYTAALRGVPREETAEFAVLAAVGAVVVLTLINLVGVVVGKWVQNLLVLLKLLGLGLIVVVGVLYARPDAFTVTKGVEGPGLGLAMILVLYAYGGWNDAAFVAADMRSRRDIPKALILGTLGITIIYLAVNLAYILGLGFDNARQYRPTIAADVLSHLGDTGAKIITLIVMTSALGAMNGLIFTGSRVYTALGSEHRIFALLGRWSPTLKAPIWSLLVQAVITIGMILLVGTKTGRDMQDSILTTVGLAAIPWEQYYGGFNTLFAGTAPVFWIFFLLTGLSVFVLRWKDAGIERPFRLRFPWFPLLPLVFCAMCGFGFYSAITYAGYLSLIGFIPLGVGVVLYLIGLAMGNRTPSLPADKV
jgi:amino acid transporter